MDFKINIKESATSLFITLQPSCADSCSNVRTASARQKLTPPEHVVQQGGPPPPHHRRVPMPSKAGVGGGSEAPRR